MKPVGNTAVQLNAYFAMPSLRLQHAGQRDVLIVIRRPSDQKLLQPGTANSDQLLEQRRLR